MLRKGAIFLMQSLCLRTAGALEAFIKLRRKIQMKKTRKYLSVLLAALMLSSSTAAVMSVDASTGQLCSKYATNPDNKFGKQKTITIDGSFSDWSEDMLIAQGAARGTTTTSMLPGRW